MTPSGQHVTHELIPRGSETRVTRHNIHSYIHTLANHKQNVEAHEQCRALRAGFQVCSEYCRCLKRLNAYISNCMLLSQSMIPLEWIRMFGSTELQLLISGDQRRIDIAGTVHVTNRVVLFC